MFSISSLCSSRMLANFCPRISVSQFVILFCMLCSIKIVSVINYDSTYGGTKKPVKEFYI